MIKARAVLVTGCSSGIGLCAARTLAARGHQIIASARKDEDVARLRSEGLTALTLDLDDTESIRQAVSDTLDLTGGALYGLFNNGAYGQPGAVEDLSRDALRAQMETNLLGWHDLTRQVIPVMRRQGEGRIIQNSSVLGLVALAYRGAYNASKFALEGLTYTLRLELRGSGIDVCLIEPGPIQTRFRTNGYLMWKKYVDADRSVHRENYLRLEKRLSTKDAVAPFTLPPEAVVKRVVHALESRRPRVRYYVTAPTYLFAFLKRVLSHRAMDRILTRV